MPYAWMPGTLKKKNDTYFKMMQPVNNTLPSLTPLPSGCNRPPQMNFEDQCLDGLITYILLAI